MRETGREREREKFYRFWPAYEVSAAFQVFLLMAQNKVGGLTQQCCEEVLELLAADSALWEYTEQQFGETFVELLASEQTSRDVVVQLMLHRSLPILAFLTSLDGSMQRLVGQWSYP